jgi:uracil-DNA glycosylase
MPKILLIGEARGKTEEEYDHGFTGSSGIELGFMLHDSGLTGPIPLFCSKCKLWGAYPSCKSCLEPLYPSAPDMIHFWTQLKAQNQIEITNVFETHPPDNDLGHIFSPQAKSDFMPSLKYETNRPISWVKPEYHHHLHTLWDRISKTKPNLCILLGNTACWAILKQTKIAQIRGTTLQSPFLGIKCLPTYHPANILRNYPNRPVVLADLAKAKRECKYPEIRRTRRKATFHATIQEIENWIKLPTSRYTIDIESGYALFTSSELKKMTSSMRYALSSQISMIGFAINKTDALVIEFMTRNSPDLSYWSTKEEEIKAWNLASYLLQTPYPKTFQNGVYDMVRLLYAGIKTRNARDDTMLLHHSLFPEMLKGLGFMGSIYTDEQAWKTLYRKGESLKKDE